MAKLSRSHAADIVPADDYAKVTPNDTEDLPEGPCRALWVGGAGYLSINSINDKPIDNIYIPVGGLFPGKVKRVRVATLVPPATEIIALY